MVKTSNMVRKTLVANIIVLFLITTVAPLAQGMVIIKNENNNISGICFDDSPKVEIITPKNGSIVYDSNVNISVKCTDDDGISDFNMRFGTYNHNGGSGHHLSEPKKHYFFNQTIIVASGYSLIFATAYDEEGNVGHDFSVFFYYSNNSIPTSNPPKVEILTPEDGSAVYNKNVSMSVKYTDDDGIVKFGRATCYGAGNGGGDSGLMDPMSEYYYNNTISKVFPGYNWVIAWAYDINGSLGYDISLYRYDELENIFIIGVISDRSVTDNYTTFKAKALLYIDSKPLIFNFCHSGEEIIISNHYSGYIGLRFIIGRFNASMIAPL